MEQKKASARQQASDHAIRYPEKRRAHAAVHKAILSGKLVRPDRCQLCWIECKPQGHHQDHFNQLDVIWLCDTCHRLADSCLRTFFINNIPFTMRQTLV